MRLVIIGELLIPYSEEIAIIGFSFEAINILPLTEINTTNSASSAETTK